MAQSESETVLTEHHETDNLDPRTDAPARPGTPVHIAPVQLGNITVPTPVVLSPMAGVTNWPFRVICEEYGPDGLYVAEMITARALVAHNPKALRLCHFAKSEKIRSLQLYGVNPSITEQAAKIVVDGNMADHVDLNFGCPVPKVTRKGGGAALPWKLDLFEGILHAAVDAARSASRDAGRAVEVPVTIKMRLGIDDDHLTFLDAARIAQRTGVAAVGLHARTLEQHYAGHARWERIAELRRALPDVPVLGNGDIWSAADAVRMMRQTGCDGVVVGRGCQGRPWLFTELVAATAPEGAGRSDDEGRPYEKRPGLRQVAAVIRRHAELMVEHFGEEFRALREMRKHMSWYLKGYKVGGEARHALGLVESLADLDAKLAALDLDQPYPGEDAEGPRGRAGNPKQPHLPDGWLGGRELDDAFRAVLAKAEIGVSGG